MFYLTISERDNESLNDFEMQRRLNGQQNIDFVQSQGPSRTRCQPLFRGIDYSWHRVTFVETFYLDNVG